MARNPFSVLTPIIAMILITALLVIAMSQQINGAILSAGIAVIAGLGGYTVGKSIKRK